MITFHIEMALKLLNIGAAFNVTFLEGQQVYIETTMEGYAKTITMRDFVEAHFSSFDESDVQFVRGTEAVLTREHMEDLANMVVPDWRHTIGREALHGGLKIPDRNPMRCSFFLFDDGEVEHVSAAQALAAPSRVVLPSGFRGRLGCAVRILPTKPFTLDDLRLPQLVKSVADVKGGLLLVVGPPGVGKSTTAASFVQHRNQNLAGSIVTCEAPIEVPLRAAASSITQRELGVNVASVQLALKDAERNFAHTMFIGEIQSQADQVDTFNAAKHGMFVVATAFSHSATDAVKALVADIDQTGANGADLVSSTLLAVIFQARLPSKRQGKWEFAYECLVVHDQPQVMRLIAERDFVRIQSDLTADRRLSLNGSLAELVRQGRVLEEVALVQAYNKVEASELFRRQR